MFFKQNYFVNWVELVISDYVIDFLSTIDKELKTCVLDTYWGWLTWDTNLIFTFNEIYEAVG